MQRIIYELLETFYSNQLYIWKQEVEENNLQVHATSQPYPYTPIHCSDIVLAYLGTSFTAASLTIPILFFSHSFIKVHWTTHWYSSPGCRSLKYSTFKMRSVRPWNGRGLNLFCTLSSPNGLDFHTRVVLFDLVRRHRATARRITANAPSGKVSYFIVVYEAIPES